LSQRFNLQVAEPKTLGTVIVMSDIGDDLLNDLHALATNSRIENASRYHKTGPGQYGEGDRFIGVCLPDIRKVAKTYIDMPFVKLEEIINSPIHEERLCGLVILTLRYNRDLDQQSRKKLFTFYMKMLRAGHVNSWDLVDATAPIIGDYLLEQPDHMELLTKLAQSKSVWQRRCAIIFTFAFLRKGITTPTLAVAEKLLDDRHDLIHKAVGWMLRETGKGDPVLLRTFLTTHATHMSRTSLRYAIEKFPELERREWLAKDTTKR